MRTKRQHRLTFSLFTVLFCGATAWAQLSRVTQPVNNERRTVLAGNLHPQAVPANDQGRVTPSLAMPYVTLTLERSASQEAELRKLLAEQQTPGSPNYHHWLSPDEFGERFGASDADIETVTQWVQRQGLQVVSVARGKSWIAVSGTAAQAEAAFRTEIHNYLVKGETHYANATDPSVPAAFAGVVKGIRGLSDFHLKPRLARASRVKVNYTNASCDSYCVAPDDFATIYDVTPLYSAGIDGTGQKIAVAGQIEVNVSDIQQFRSLFHLPANDPQMVLVPGSKNPGNSPTSGDLGESDLDIEWAGAVARNASIIFVYSSDVLTSVQYAIDQDLAKVISLSYGSCEPETARTEYDTFVAWAEQANAEGITWLAASGDNGAADCDDSENPGVAVDLPGSVPEVTSVGGTEFNEGTGKYWSATNTANNASALSYIPEMTWNDSAQDGEPSAGGGGASVLFTKPAWQNVSGVPSDNARDVPDVSMDASDAHDPYLVYTSGKLQGYGGTSFGGPTFGGLVALLNQELKADGLGNINPKLYSLAPSGWNSGVFHDVTTGNNIVTAACSRHQTSCGNVPVGYYAGKGYDLTTGLGSVDAYQLVKAWSGGTVTTQTPPPSSRSNITLTSNLRTVASNEVVYLTATVTSSDGTTPSGSVSFSIGATSLGSATLTGTGGTATATLAINGLQLPVGSGAITATYNSATSAPLAVSVTSSGSGSAATPALTSITNGASFQHSFAPGAVLSVFGSNLAPVTQSASSVPLPLSVSGTEVLVNGIAAPLYYVSPGQLNVQIPYEVNVGSQAVVSVNNNGQVTTQSFPVAAAAPGIFTNSSGALVPTSSAAVGQEVAFYITGVGAVQPAIADGAAPANSTAIAALPAPLAPTTVKIGGANAVVDFIGIPWGLVGVTQINVTVPNGIAAGPQPVIVTVDSVASPPATITITN